MTSPASDHGLVGATGVLVSVRAIPTLLAIIATTSLCAATAIAAPQVRGPATAPPPLLGDVKSPAPAHAPKEAMDPERATALERPTLVGPPAPPKPQAPLAAPEEMFANVLYDVATDGSIWARGRTYKAHFAADGFTYVPFLGSDAPRNYPISFALQSINAGGKPLAFQIAAPARDGDRIVINRGLVQEVYLLTPDSVEQQFIFTSKPANDELVINLAIDTDMTAADVDGRLRFSNDLGGATYSKAVTIDASKAATDSPTNLIDGKTVAITLPAALVRGAKYPMTVDPIVSTYTLTNTVASTIDRTPDVAYDATNDGYCVAWEHDFSATDGDVYSERRLFNGNAIGGSLATIDSSTANWRRPRIANNNANNEYMVVGEVGAAGARQVWSRWRSASSNITGPAVQVSDGAFAGEQFNADIGGDSWTGGGGVFYLVVWERAASATDHDILGRLVTPVTGAVSGGVILIENSVATIYHNPTISNGNATVQWNVAYQYTFAPGDEDIYGAQVGAFGAVNTMNFAIDSTVSNNINPAISGSLTSGSYMVVYEEGPATVGDLYARVYIGPNLAAGNNLTVLEGVNLIAARRRPSIDSNADHFVVASTQEFFPSDYDPYVSTYCVGGGIRVAEQHRNLDISGLNTIEVKVASTYGSGGIHPSEFGIAWDMRGASGGGEIRGAYFLARTSCCKSDIVTNGVTDVSDLLGVITGWGTCLNPSICVGDINGDSVTDVTDLLAVITSWGPCP